MILNNLYIKVQCIPIEVTFEQYKLTVNKTKNMKCL